MLAGPWPSSASTSSTRRSAPCCFAEQRPATAPCPDLHGARHRGRAFRLLDRTDRALRLLPALAVRLANAARAVLQVKDFRDKYIDPYAYWWWPPPTASAL